MQHVNIKEEGCKAGQREGRKCIKNWTFIKSALLCHQLVYQILHHKREEMDGITTPECYLLTFLFPDIRGNSLVIYTCNDYLSTIINHNTHK